MITKQEAITANNFTHVTLKNADGTALRARRNGKTKTWKTRPNEWSLPVKYGMYDAFRIDQNSASNWNVSVA